MRLTDLNARMEGTVEDGKVYFECPVCKGTSRPHSVMAYISSQPYHEESYETPRFWKNGSEVKKKIWQASGVFPDSLTLTPSIDLIEADENGNKIRTLCWHGHVTNGAIT